MQDLDNQFQEELLNQFRAWLPVGWSAAPRPVPQTRWPAPDMALLVSGPDGQQALFVVEMKARVEPRDVPSVAAQLRAYAESFGGNAVGLINSGFLGQSTRERLKEAGVSFVDSTGNARVSVSRPALFIEARGDDRSPFREPRRARSLKGAKAGRLVRALCEGKPPFALRKLSQSAGVDPGYASRLLAFLDSEELIRRERIPAVRPRPWLGETRRERGGPIIEVRWRKLIERWARDYSFLGSNQALPCLEPRGLSGLAERITALGERAALTGSAAAADLAPVAPTKMLQAYVESPEKAAAALGLRPTESGANVLLVRPCDPVVFDRTTLRGAVRRVSPVQAAVDLLTGPGRGPSEGRALLDWMEANEPAWRG